MTPQQAYDLLNETHVRQAEQIGNAWGQVEFENWRDAHWGTPVCQAPEWKSGLYEGDNPFHKLIRLADELGVDEAVHAAQKAAEAFELIVDLAASESWERTRQFYIEDDEE